jgi:hypothetical protein
MSKTIKFSDVYDRAALIGGYIPPREGIYYISYALFVSLIAYLAENIEHPIPWFVSIFAWIGLMGAHWVLIGDRPWAFFGKFLKGRFLGVSKLIFNPTDTELKPKVPTQKIGKKTAHPVENISDLQSYIEFRYKGQKIGAYLVKSKKGWEVKFAYRHIGIPTVTNSENGMELVKLLESGANSLGLDEVLTLELSSFSDCSDRIAALQAQIDQPNLPFGLKFLLRSEQERTKILADSHRWNAKKSTIYYSVFFGQDTEKTNSIVEKFTFAVGRLVSSVTLQKPPTIKELLSKLLSSAYTDGFSRVDDLLNQRLQLSVEPLTAQEMWEIDWQRVNKGVAPKLPSLIIVNEAGVKLAGRGEDHPDARLHKAAPVEHKTYVQLPGKQKYAGVVVLTGKIGREWEQDNPSDRLKQLQYGSAAFNYPNVYDTRIVFQISGKRQSGVLRNADKLAEQANRSDQAARARGKLDQNAEYQREASRDSSWVLRDGGKVALYSWVVVVERDTPEELDEAIGKLCALPEFSGEILEREVEYANQIWWQTLPTQADRLLQKPWDRRKTDTTAALVALMPVLMDYSRDQKGVAYLTQDNFTPIYIDPFCPAPHRHSFKVAGTGAGKTVDHLGHIIAAMAQDGNVVIVDASRADGSGAFDPIVDLLEGERFSTKTDSYNFFEGGDFRLMDDEAISSFREFLVRGLSDMVCTDDDASTVQKKNADLLSILVESFLACPEIQAKRDAAFDGGIGSSAWKQFPTLRQFLGWMILENLPVMNQTKDNQAALQQMGLALGAVLARPLGAAIARPSTFKSRSKLVLVAIAQTDAQDIKPVALAAASFVFSNALAAKGKTLFIGDENTYLAPLDAYMSMVSSFYLKGRTMGIHANLIGQTLAPTLQNKKYAQNIFDNVSTYMGGRLSRDGAKDLIDRGVPPHLFEKKFRDRDGGQRTDREKAVSRWIISEPDEGRHFKVFSAPSYDQLALAVNGTQDVIDRAGFQAQYPDDPYRATREFANQIRSKSNDAELFGIVGSSTDDGTDEIDY